MDILITGRKTQITDAFKERVEDKLASVVRLKDRVDRIEVQVTAYEHRSQPDQSIQVEITLRSKGPVIRAEGKADEKNAAFDAALDKLKAILRRAADRRKTHRGLRAHDIAPEDLADSMVPAALAPIPTAPAVTQPSVHNIAGLEVQGEGPLVVREKFFDAVPLTLAQALDEMELVGHDFFLYVDAQTNAPSVVYRRRGYDYGVLHLKLV
ncbi:MAG: ribosome-associated translation inhibitor RaiA [Propionibacteriaceae bacterium]|jgi:ribosomal subunit interface protein|nr:ribosome-associated translation inhibitor RaiA [Propionibacteriaceae bacterium]